MIMQGNPTREEDYIFKHESFYNSDGYSDSDLNCIVPYSPDLDKFEKGRFWDLAGSKNAPTKANDYYCGILAAKDHINDILYVFNMERAKRQALGVLDIIKSTIVSDGYSVETVIEQEPASQSNLFLAQMFKEFPQYKQKLLSVVFCPPQLGQKIFP